MHFSKQPIQLDTKQQLYHNYSGNHLRSLFSSLIQQQCVSMKPMHASHHSGVSRIGVKCVQRTWDFYYFSLSSQCCPITFQQPRLDLISFMSSGQNDGTFLLEFQTPCPMLQLPQTKPTQILPHAILFKVLTLSQNVSVFCSFSRAFECWGAVCCLLVCIVIGIVFIVVICRMVSYLFTPPSLMQNTSPTLLFLVLKAEHTSKCLFFFPIFHYKSSSILISLFHIDLWRDNIDITISILSNVKWLL